MDLEFINREDPSSQHHRASWASQPTQARRAVRLWEENQGEITCNYFISPWHRMFDEIPFSV